MSDADLVHAIEFLTVCGAVFVVGFVWGSRLIFDRRCSEEAWEAEQKRRRRSF